MASKSQRCASLITICLSFMFVILFFSCGNPMIGSSSGFSTDSSSNRVTFYTNDPSDYGSAYVYEIPASIQDPFTSFQGTVKKNSGYQYSDFGIVVCRDGNSYIGFVIDAAGNFKIFRSIYGVKTNFQNWTSSPFLNQGYGAENVLKIEQPTSGTFNAYINGNLVHTFSESSLLSGTSGYFVYVANENYENLNTDPVEVCFE